MDAMREVMRNLARRRWHKDKDSNEAQEVRQRVVVEGTCAFCGQQFSREVAIIAQHRVRYCSLRCARAAAMLRYAERTRERSANDSSLSKRE